MKIEMVRFEGDALEAVENEDGLWVNLRRVCEALGLDASAQLQRLRGEFWATMAEIPTVAADGRRRQMSMLHIDALPMWLATIRPGKVAEAVRPKLRKYQCECARVLRAHFLGHADVDRLSMEERRLELEERKEQRRHAALLLKIPSRFGLGDAANQALGIAAAQLLTGRDLHQLLPPVDERTHTLTDVGNMFGVTAQRVGRVRKSIGIEGNRRGLCEVRLSKSPHSDKNVEQTIVTDKAATLIGAELVAGGHISRDAYLLACEHHALEPVPQFKSLPPTG